MKVRLLKSATLVDLQQTVSSNLGKYRQGDFNDIVGDSTHWFEYDCEIDEAILDNLKPPKDSQYFEVENSEVLGDALKDLTPYEARDERLWVYLSHTLLLPHARLRWPIPENDEEAAKHISKHFFARDKRQIERDNVGSRLWWMAHLCKRVKGLDRREALEAFLFRSDVRANLVERPTTSQSSELFSAIVVKLAASFKGGKHLFERATFRRFMMEVNSEGGYKLLDCLPSSQIEAILDEIVKKRLNLQSL